MKVVKDNIVYAEITPSVKEYNQLRKSIYWHTLDHGRIKAAFQNTLYTVVAKADSKVIGMGRIVGDDGLYYYLHDIIVTPKFQGLGIGSGIMERLIHKLDTLAPEKCGAFIGLMTAPGLEKFYNRFGFEISPIENHGMRIWKYDIFLSSRVN